MNYFIVPGVSYQTQEKMKKLEEERKKKKKSSSESSKSRKGISRKSSQATITSKHKPETKSEHKSSTKMDPVDAQELTNNLKKLKETSSSVSLKQEKKTGRSTSVASSTDSPKSIASRERERSLVFVPTKQRNQSKESVPTTQSTPHTSFSSLRSKYSNVPKASTGSNESGSKRNPEEKNDIFETYFQKISPVRQSDDPTFVPFTDLSLMNTPETIIEGLSTPAYQMIRFNNFLQLVSSSHENDAVSFAGVRHTSLVKFIQRHRCFKEAQIANSNDDNSIPKNQTNSFYDSLLTMELFAARDWMRKLLRQRTKTNTKHASKVCEELIQLNFTNYVRFILELPREMPENATEETLTHYRFKSRFLGIAIEILRFKSDNTEDGIGMDISNFLLQLINKLSYEYILLEKYRIDIWNKLGKNSLVDLGTLKQLYQSFQESTLYEKRRPVKVLLYNMFSSAQYPWYFSIHIPFVRVIESSTYSEDLDIINQFDAYPQWEESTTKHSFEEQDKVLQDYFKRTKLGDFAKYRHLTSEDLVHHHTTLCSGRNEAKNMSEDGTQTLRPFKPFNFEYYNKPLATIPSNSIDMVQSRDLYLQLTQENYKVILRELHRILISGGTLETPIFQVGRDEIKNVLSVGSLDSDWKYFDIDLVDLCGTIPNFAEFLLTELIAVFGEGQIKYGIVMLNSVRDISNYLYRESSLYYHEMFDSMDSFCSKFCAGEAFDTDDERLVCLIFIKAKKQ